MQPGKFQLSQEMERRGEGSGVEGRGEGGRGGHDAQSIAMITGL